MDLNNGVELLEQSTYFLDSVLQRTDQISQTEVDEKIVEQHIVVVDQTVRLLRIPRYTPGQHFEY